MGSERSHAGVGARTGHEHGECTGDDLGSVCFVFHVIFTPTRQVTRATHRIQAYPELK